MSLLRHRPNGVPGENRGLAVCSEDSDNGRTILRAEKSAGHIRALVAGDTERERRKGSPVLRGRPHWVTARRREINTVLVWRLDRWGTVSGRPVVALQELERLGVGFVSLTEALNLTTPRGRAGADGPIRWRRFLVQ